MVTILIICIVCIASSTPGSDSGSKVIPEESMTIVQVDNRFTEHVTDWTTAGYWDESAEINRRYAEKSGYHYEQINVTAIPHTKKVGEVTGFADSNRASDWILFLDSDAFVSKQDWNLSFVLNHFHVTKDIHFIIEHSPPTGWKPHKEICPEITLGDDQQANTGVYLLRDTEIGRGIMNEWQKAVKKYHRTGSDNGIFNCALPLHKEYAKYIKISMGQYFTNLSGGRHGGYQDAWIQHYTSGGSRQGVRDFLQKMLEVDQDGKNKEVEDDSESVL